MGRKKFPRERLNARVPRDCLSRRWKKQTKRVTRKNVLRLAVPFHRWFYPRLNRHCISRTGDPIKQSARIPVTQLFAVCQNARKEIGISLLVTRDNWPDAASTRSGGRLAVTGLLIPADTNISQGVIFKWHDAYLCRDGRDEVARNERQTEQIGFRQRGRQAAAARSAVPRPRVCHRRQETLAPVNNPIKMDRKPW